MSNIGCISRLKSRVSPAILKDNERNQKQMSNRTKPPKSTINLFRSTSSQKNRHDPSLLLLPESKYYRKQLEPLLGAAVDIDCDQFTLIPDTVEGKSCHRILLKNAEVVKAPIGRGVVLPIHIQHIWALVDDGWIDRNVLPQFCTLRIRGLLHLYNHNGEKNIGFQTFSVRPMQVDPSGNHNKEDQRSPDEFFG